MQKHMKEKLRQARLEQGLPVPEEPEPPAPKAEEGRVPPENYEAYRRRIQQVLDELEAQLQ